MKPWCGFIFILFIGFVFSLTACESIRQSGVEQIEIDADTVMETYKLGDFNLEKIRLNIYYEDGTTHFIMLQESMLESGEIDLFSLPGTHTVNIAYEDFKTTLTVVMIERNATEVTITFESNGGSVIADRVIKAGSFIELPDSPIKDGYTFDGWYADEALTVLYDFSTIINQNMTLYAKWVFNEDIECFDTTKGSFMAWIDVMFYAKWEEND